MIIKEPCIIDTSHWDVPNYDILDERVVGVIMKATQGKSYVDPTFASQWLGAGRARRPRSAYHFMDLNDVSSQVENFLTACERVGAIVSGRWMGEIPPVLDAEIELPMLDRLALALGVKNQTATASQLAAQYKSWLYLVEAELHVRPILYASKWTLMTAGNPAWVADYRGWWAQYPNDPDGQDAPAYLPVNATDWFLWQYSEKGELQGFTGDVSVFNGSMEEWIFETGWIPPIGEEKMFVTPKDKSGSRIRSGAGTQYVQVGSLAYGDQMEVSALTGNAGSEQWAQVTYAGLPAYVAIWYAGAQTGVLSGTLPQPPSPPAEPVRTHVIEVYSDGTISVDGGARQ